MHVMRLNFREPSDRQRDRLRHLIRGDRDQSGHKRQRALLHRGEPYRGEVWGLPDLTERECSS